MAPAGPPTPGHAESQSGGGDAAGVVATARSGCYARLRLEHFLGQWRDSRGNEVWVEPAPSLQEQGQPQQQSTWQQQQRQQQSQQLYQQLKVQLTHSQGPRPPIHLRLTQNNGKFTCGHFELCPDRSSRQQIFWVNIKDRGKPSIWQRGHSVALDIREHSKPSNCSRSVRQLAPNRGSQSGQAPVATLAAPARAASPPQVQRHTTPLALVAPAAVAAPWQSGREIGRPAPAQQEWPQRGGRGRRGGRGAGRVKAAAEAFAGAEDTASTAGGRGAAATVANARAFAAARPAGGRGAVPRAEVDSTIAVPGLAGGGGTAAPVAHVGAAGATGPVGNGGAEAVVLPPGAASAAGAMGGGGWEVSRPGHVATVSQTRGVAGVGLAAAAAPAATQPPDSWGGAGAAPPCALAQPPAAGESGSPAGQSLGDQGLGPALGVGAAGEGQEPGGRPCGGASHDMHRLEQISRKLSHVLRHGDRVAVRQDGFCQVSELLRLRRLQELGCTLNDLQAVVAGIPESGNTKERFQLYNDSNYGPLIRATQGFSRKDVVAEQAYRRLTLSDPVLPGPCVHGTYRWHWESICRSGLLPGGLRGRQQRSEVHFACEEPGEEGQRAVSGMRSDCNLVIWLDLRRALEEGLPFFMSNNGVVLSPGDSTGCIPPQYFQRAMDYTVDPPLLLWHSGSPIQ